MIKNPNTVANFLNTKAPDGSPCPINLTQPFWIQQLRKLALEGIDLNDLVAIEKRRANVAKARAAREKKRLSEKEEKALAEASQDIV